MTSINYFELSRLHDEKGLTDIMVLTFGNQEIRFGIREIEELKNEIRGWELRYYGD